MDLLADLAERLPAELRRSLSVPELEAELARALFRLARDTARSHLSGEREPPDGETLFDLVVATTYRRLKTARDEQQNADADRELAALM